MKKISLSLLIATLILSLGAGGVFATDLGTASAALGTATVTVDNGELSGQTAAITFTTSINVYLAAVLSAASNAENYIASGAHLNGDKAYGIASSGGGVRWMVKTPATATFTGPATISTAGVVDWGTYATMD